MMAGLILKLRPGEQLMINGVVVENGNQKTRLYVKTTDAHILRLRDAMRPEDATTPLKQAYFVAQMAVAGHIPKGGAAGLILNALKHHTGQNAAQIRQVVAARAQENEYYKAMRYLGDVIAMDEDNGESAVATAQDAQLVLAQANI